MRSFFTYLQNVRTELSHVVWPKWPVAIAHTIVIVLISALTATFIGVLDYAFTNIVGSVVNGF